MKKPHSPFGMPHDHRSKNKLTRRDKIRLLVLVALLGGLALTLIFTIKRPTGPTKGFSDNVIVQQRIKNLGQSR